MSDDIRGLHLHFDGAAGAAGDMTLGALFDLGVPEAVVHDVVAALGLGDRVTTRRVVKGGVSAVDVKVRVDDARGLPGPGPGAHEHGAHEHGAHEHEYGAHEHEHGAHEHGAHEHGHEEQGPSHDHAHTLYSDVLAQIRAAKLDPEVEALAVRIFDRVARAESKLHGVSLERVAFHEVGAIDSIVDIVGAAAALCWLRPSSVSAAPVAVGRGVVRCAHGALPVPAPATLEILRERGAPITDGNCARELCTPTGAAILAEVVGQWGAMPPLSPVAVGYGAGDRDLPDRPNVLRALVGRTARTTAASDELYRVEANVDDMSPELCEHAAEAMFAAGAVDVWWTPITMKKARPALQLSALAPTAALDPIIGAALRETTSIGVRYALMARRVLDREHRNVTTPYGEIPIKVASLDGAEMNAAPEYEACRAAARAHGVPLKVVFAAAVAAHRAVR